METLISLGIFCVCFSLLTASAMAVGSGKKPPFGIFGMVVLVFGLFGSLTYFVLHVLGVV